MNAFENEASPSPFHAGEREIQTKLGVREGVEAFGRKVIRDFMPEQHQTFYGKLPFVFVGHADNKGWPWASVLFGAPGFMQVKDERSLSLNTKPLAGDPLSSALNPKQPLGFLGIELPTRRRNRFSAHIDSLTDQGVNLSLDQVFGNCPQYIQNRSMVARNREAHTDPQVEDINRLDEESQNLIATSDTFFVASYMADGSGEASEGADVSHRGGRPGFVRVDDDSTLTIPDYLGNNHYNTFGNFVTNGKAGLLFLDFEKGHVLTLTGTVEILWDSPETQFFEGAQRLWRFHLDHGRKLKHVLPYEWDLQEYSPNSLLTGTWQEAEALKRAEQQKDQWMPYRVEKIVNESRVIKSFYLSAQGHHPAKFIPGQFLTVKAVVEGKEHIRTYTLSSAPADDHYRISVKREDSPNKTVLAGKFSHYLHNEIHEGDILYAKAPSGAFRFDSESNRPVLLFAAGVGITPMISIARHALLEAVRTRKMRPIVLIGAAKSQEQRAFFPEFNELSSASGNQIQAYWALSEPEQELVLGKDFDHRGRITKEWLQSLLPMDDYDCYLCGPSGFMQATFDMLRELGVSDDRIFAEAFGPASLQRDSSTTLPPHPKHTIADSAVIEFTKSKVEQAWSAGDGSLLEFAEAHGLTPEFGCRSGQCGACKAKLHSGKVVHEPEHHAPIGQDEVLVCCAFPAKEEGEEVVRVSVGL